MVLFGPNYAEANMDGVGMSVGEICNRNVAVIGKHDSIYAAARLMRDQHVSDVVVVESSGGVNIPVGILTDRDIVVSAVAEELDLNTVLISDFMTRNFLLADDDDDVLGTLKRMRYKGIRRIPVINQRHGLTGILSIDDILDSLVEQLNDIDQIIAHTEHKSEQLDLQLSN